MNNFHFGKNLKRLREEIKPNRGQNGMAGDLDISQSRLSKIESESHVPDDDFVTKAANYLGIPRKELLPPDWFIETVKREVYVLTKTGHALYLLLIVGFAWEGIHDINFWLERSLLEKAAIILVFAGGGFALYRFTVRKIVINETIN